LELFVPSTGMTALSAAGVRCGLAICADIHCADVFADNAQAGAQVVFECAAPGLYGTQQTGNWLAGYEWWRGECRDYLARYAGDYHVAIAVATQAGRTCDEGFPGGGYLFGPDGAYLSETEDWREGLHVAEIPVA
jgi:predicted amidohydrolase